MRWTSAVIFLCVTHVAASQLQWTPHSLPTSKPVLAVTYRDGRFVAVGDHTICTSTNGVDWDAQTEPSGTQINAVTSGLGMFVAVSEQPFNFTQSYGKILVSTNGSEWIVKDIGPHQLTSVTFHNGLFVAVGRHLVVRGHGYDIRASFFRSRNGLDWEYDYVDLPGDLQAVAASNDRFVAVGRYVLGSGVIYTSTKGVDWKPVSTDLAGFDLLRITVGQGNFVVGGNSAEVLVSSDGEKWTPVSVGINPPIGVLTFVNDLFLVGQMYGSGLSISADAFNWATQDSGLSGLTGLAFGKHRLIGVTYLNGAAISQDLRLPMLNAAITDKKIRLSGIHEIGASYQLQWTTNLVEWNHLHNVEATNSVLSFEVEPSHPVTVYRSSRVN